MLTFWYYMMKAVTNFTVSQRVQIAYDECNCSHFTLENRKKSFFNSIIHTYFRLFTLSQKKTSCYPLTTTPEKCRHTTL